MPPDTDTLCVTNLDSSFPVIHKVGNVGIFRWFKFTLKPPYSITHGKLQIGHFGHFLLDFFGQIWTQGTLRHILGPILVIFEIYQFLTIPGLFEYFSENGWSQKIKVFSMKEPSLPPLSV